MVVTNCWVWHWKIMFGIKLCMKKKIFHGKSYSEEKEFMLQISKAFILPSISEGIPIAVLEALSHKSLCC